MTPLTYDEVQVQLNEPGVFTQSILYVATLNVARKAKINTICRKLPKTPMTIVIN